MGIIHVYTKSCKLECVYDQYPSVGDTHDYRLTASFLCINHRFFTQAWDRNV